jgi:arsenate reductase
MKFAKPFLFLAVPLSFHHVSPCAGNAAEVRTSVREFLDQVANEDLSPERRAILDRLVQHLAQQRAQQRDQGKMINVTFICTHNSRRSQMAQVWFHVAAHVYNVADIHAYSGGTEVTACNARTIEALRRSGLEVKQLSEGENPIYSLRFSEAAEPIQVFSKVYSQQGNPQHDFVAVMCCDDADRACPLVEGADGRFALSYIDPKVADETPREQEVYDQRNRQIAAEMLYVISRVSRL